MTDHLATKEDLDLISENTADFIAFSYYSSVCTAFDTKGLKVTKANRMEGVYNKYLPTSDWGWQIDPIGLRTMSLKMAVLGVICRLIIQSGPPFTTIG